MRVGLNATCLSDRPSGARQRFLGLYRALVRRHPEIEFVVYEPRACAIARELGGTGNVVARQTPIAGGQIARLLRGLDYWQRQLRRDRLDLFECFNLPLVEAPCPTIMTIHDARHIHHDVAPLRRFANRAVWRHALRRSAHLVTVSNTMCAEIQASSETPPITTIYNGVDAAPFRAATAAPLPPYLLAVGHLEPRKNYALLVDAMAALQRQGRDIRLLIVGRDSGSREVVEQAIASHGLGDAVTIASDVSDVDLASLYRGCAALVFPSLYEGFGIPVVEAMAAGRPMVLSDLPVFRELTQDQAIYFGPGDPAAAAAAIGRVLDEPTLASRIAGYGKRRVEDFAFDTLADQIFGVYRTVLGDRLLL